jgi:Xaa-Pro aminopeptidase
MQESAQHTPEASAIPFDTAKLDRLMEEAGIDVLLTTSKHNVQYLLGAERAIFFDYMDALGVSRYLPVVVYPKGAPDKAAFIGHRLETHQRAVAPLWIPEVKTTASGSLDAMALAIEFIGAAGVPRKRIGVELAFLPMDAGRALSEALPDSEVKDALFVLERLRAVKTTAELAKLRKASELVIEAMIEVIAGHGAGHTKQEISDALRVAEAKRGLTFECCLIAAGASHNRAPSNQRWEQGDVLSLDSGGNFHGYIGDLARMAVLGKPDAELQELLAEIETIQRAAFAAVQPARPVGR